MASDAVPVAYALYKHSLSPVHMAGAKVDEGPGGFPDALCAHCLQFWDGFAEPFYLQRGGFIKVT